MISSTAAGTYQRSASLASIEMGACPPPLLSALALSHSLARKCFTDVSRKERRRRSAWSRVRHRSPQDRSSRFSKMDNRVAGHKPDVGLHYHVTQISQ